MLKDGWNEQRLELARVMWKDGKSAAEIAATVRGGLTRNAVLGMIHRKGWAERSVGRLPGTGAANRSRAAYASMAAKNRRAKKAQADALKPPRPAPKPKANAALRALLETLPVDHVTEIEELFIPESERKTVETLEAHDCRWPIGDVQVEGFHFCGRPKLAGVPYCEFHSRRAYRPFAPRIQPAGGKIVAPAPDTAPEIEFAAGGASERESEEA